MEDMKMEERNIALEEVNQIIPVVEQIENLYAQVTQLEQRSETIMADEERRKKRFKKLLRLPARLIVIATALVILHLNKKNLELTQAGIIFGVGIATAIIFYFLMSKTVVGNMKPRKESLRRIASNDELIQQLHGEMGDYYLSLPIINILKLSISSRKLCSTGVQILLRKQSISMKIICISRI